MTPFSHIFSKFVCIVQAHERENSMKLYRKIKPIYCVQPLTAETIDHLSQQTEKFLVSIQTERANILRIRLSMEEALLRWRDRFGEEVSVSYYAGTNWRRPVINLRLAGDRYDPTVSAENDLGGWSDGLLAEIGLSPQFSYRRGTNELLLRLPRPRKNPALSTLTDVVLGLVIGAAGSALLPETIQLRLIRTILGPLQDMFYRILNAASGPVIFFTVLVSICGAGSIAVSGKAGRKMLLRFIIFSSLLTAAALLLSIQAFSLHYYNGPMSDTRFASVLDFFLQVFPNDILSPFIEGNSPQLILIAVVLGNALLVVSDRNDSLMSLIDQINKVGLLLADWVGRFSHFIIVILLILNTWNRSLSSILDFWKPFLLFLVLTVAAILVWTLWICISKGVSVRKLVKKLWPSALIALRTASVDAAYGDSVLCCERRLGISRELTSYGLPLGLVIYMPAGMIATMVFTLYAAKSYGIVISAIWCVMAAVLIVTLLMATPPVLGCGVLAYATIFLQLGIPSSALTIALLADILFGFVTAAGNQVLLQLELVLQAGRSGDLDLAVLRK